MSKNFGRALRHTITVDDSDHRGNNENVTDLRNGAIALLGGSVLLCFVATPVGAFGIVASLVLLVFCSIADGLTNRMSATTRSGNKTAGFLWFLLIVLAAVVALLLALGGGLAVFAEMAGRL